MYAKSVSVPSSFRAAKCVGGTLVAFESGIVVERMATHVRWLRVSYWTGAIADAFAAAAMLIPDLGNALYGRTDFAPGPEFSYAMILAASLMLGWTALLLWADRKPVERRGVLMLTIPVICGLIAGGVYAVSSGFIAVDRMRSTWILQSLLVAMFSFSYWRSRPSKTNSD